MKPHRKMEVRAAETSTPASAFVIVQGRALLDVFLAIAAAADIEVSIKVKGVRDGETIILMEDVADDIPKPATP